MFREVQELPPSVVERHNTYTYIREYDYVELQHNNGKSIDVYLERRV
jgi:hypothetical protein